MLLDQRLNALSAAVRYRKGHLNVAEILFDSEMADVPDVDILRYFYNPNPIPGCRCTKIHSLCVSLRRDPEELLADMTRTTRSQIRQAQRGRPHL
jgi:hypothetical protein